MGITKSSENQKWWSYDLFSLGADNLNILFIHIINGSMTSDLFSINCSLK